MKKALEILKEIKNQKPFVYILTSVWCRALIVNESSKLDKAIAELEEAMKPKTCDGCKYLDGVICKHDRGLYCVRQFEADYFVKDTQC